MIKTCINCKYLQMRKRWGIVIEPTCRGQSGKKWPISVAQKPERCGDKKVWWARNGATQ